MQKSSKCLQLSNLTMKKQIITLTFIILILTILITSMILYTNNILVSFRFTESSQIMYLKSAKRNLQTNLHWYKSIILKTLEINGLELITFHKLYNEANKMVKSMDPINLNVEMNMNYGGMNNIPKILCTEDGFGGQNTTDSFLCYSNLSQLADPLSYDQKVGIKIQEYFQAFGQIVYIGDLINQQFVYFYTIGDNFNFIYPCLNRGKNIFKYFPQTRNWYLDALSVYNSSNFTDYTYLLTKTYILYTANTMGLSMYLPMINQQQEFIGSIGTNILSQEFSSYIQGSNIIQMVMLVDLDGILIVHNYTVKVSDLPLMIYNQGLTGFNQEDWNYIVKKDRKTDCVGFQFNEDLLCVHNTLFDQDVLLEVTFLEQYKLYLIIFQDSTELHKFQDIQSKKIQDFFTNYLLKVISYTIYGFLFCFIFISFAIILIMSPIHKITKSMQKKINLNEWALEKVNSFQKIILSNTLLDFYKSFLKFANRIRGVLPKKKSQICLIIENIEYPTTIYRFKKYILARQMKYIYNQEKSDNINSRPKMGENLKIIINALKDSTMIQK